ncbi:leucine-rich repeat domain-containing protein [uncultured Roseobacter sp.]|uniref:leucine-rich repeat domain-containing protein n=1 Tax=uncultured Roseobacter sp. TaxID=114847 RepID=UPI00261CB3C6|nr:leucine-rich repeat domain-containing protein [uncultured Roseobacter sp.]
MSADVRHLNGSPIEDLSPLQALTKLKRLQLSGPQITDLGPLRSLTNLQKLYLAGSQVSDLAPLKALANLQLLNLIRNPVSDLTPLLALTSLEMLALDETQVNDLGPLRDLNKLWSLRLEGTRVSDLAPLKALTNLEELFLTGTPVSDLAQIATLTNLRRLELARTQVSDLAPIQVLKNLERLDIEGTSVRDLRPVEGLKNLNSDVKVAGLFFNNTQAIKHDAHLFDLAQIPNFRDRTRKTMDYLANLRPWPEPYVPEASPDGGTPGPIGEIPLAPEKDPALPLIWGEHGFAFLANNTSSDTVAEAALVDLRSLLDELLRKGNQHDDLYRISSELKERSTGAISDLNLVALHLSYQKLRRLHEGRAFRPDKFEDETVYSIEAVFNVLPDVTLADDNVRVLIERQEAERAAGLVPAQEAAAIKLLQDLRESDGSFSPEVKDIATEVVRPDFDDRLKGTRGILSQNVVVSVLSFVSLSIAEGAIGGPVGNFLYDNGHDLLAYAATMGDDAFLWAQSVLAKFRVEYEIVMGIAREVDGEQLNQYLPTHKKNGGFNK